ncbi:DUF1269 domain-containing protein [Intrasporangium sp. YIM S08009]|uniref:DUF1269 domain-containing protein n=1 Tax=Intrasporangium zincisolvens TaxID=3080018 RepID=UPI002B055DD5|nr:DUF1269 domain-containing protein [Intrasporangium sp. YIM S08009]
MSEDASKAAEPPVTVVGAVSDGAYTLLIADFADTTSAQEAYAALKEVEDGRHVEIEGVIVVKRETDGKLEVQRATDHTTRRGLTWGIVGGAALGLIFPPSIIGGAALLGAAGAAAGKVGQLHHRRELADDLESAIEPGHSGIVALVSDPAAVELQRALQRANAIVLTAIDDVVAKDVEAAAKEAEEAEDNAAEPTDTKES